MKKIVSLFMLIIFAFILMSCGKTEDHSDFEFKWSLGSEYSEQDVFKDGYEITAYKGSETVVTIPSHYNNKPVRYIGQNAFKDNTNITKIILPKTLVVFAANSFSGTTNMIDIEVIGGEGDRYLSRDGLLYGKGFPEEDGTLMLGFIPLGRLKEIVIESDVTHLSGFIFDGVYNVETITINANSSLTTISKLFTYFELDSNYSLENIYVDESQYDSLVELFNKRNPDLISLISVKP